MLSFNADRFLIALRLHQQFDIDLFPGEPIPLHKRGNLEGIPQLNIGRRRDFRDGQINGLIGGSGSDRYQPRLGQ